MNITSIDLTKRGDLAMVHRAVTAGWDVPPDIRRQIVDQLPAACKAAEGSPRRVLKVARLALAMDAYDTLAIHGASAVRGILRANPRPEGKRQPRPHRRRRRPLVAKPPGERLGC